LKDTFTHFDTNGNEKLDKDELFRLCLHIKRWTIRKYSDLWMSPMYNNSLYPTVLQCLEAFSPRDATMILNSIDKDKNGTIDFDEFSLWLSRGFQKNITILNKLSKRSTNSATMIALVVGFRFCLINTIVSKSDLEKSLIALFEQYDKDGNGHLDREELLVMIRGIEDTVQVVGNNEQAILAETSALIHGQSFTMTDDDIAYILGSMDTDGNGTLELPEWIAWLRGKEGRRGGEREVVVCCGGVVVVFGGVYWC
jgi:Ca2+-binding EF-hand superfamily protein